MESTDKCFCSNFGWDNFLSIEPIKFLGPGHGYPNPNFRALKVTVGGGEGAGERYYALYLPGTEDCDRNKDDVDVDSESCNGPCCRCQTCGGEREEDAAVNASPDDTDATSPLSELTPTETTGQFEEDGYDDFTVDEDEMEGVATEIKQKDSIPCKVVSNNGPGSFRIVLLAPGFVQRMDTFEEKFKEWIVCNSKTLAYSDDGKREFHRGEWVLVWDLHRIHEKEMRWFRGRVISKDAPNAYMIYLIDEGRLEIISNSNIRPMPKAVILSFGPALAIHCSLKTRWPASVAGPIMQEIIDGKELKAVFNSEFYNATLMTKDWQVSLKYKEEYGAGRWKSVRDEIQRKLSDVEGFRDCGDYEDSEDGMDAFTYFLDGEEEGINEGCGS